MTILYPQNKADSHAEITEYRGAHNLAAMRRQLDTAEAKVKRQATEIKRLAEALEHQKQKEQTARGLRSRLWYRANAALRLLRGEQSLAQCDTPEAELAEALSEAEDASGFEDKIRKQADQIGYQAGFIGALSKEVSGLRAEIERLTAQVEARKSEYCGLLDRHREIKHNYQQRRNLIAERDGEIDSLKSALADAKDHTSRLYLDNERLIAERDREREACKRERDAHQKKLGELSNHIGHLRDLVDTLPALSRNSALQASAIYQLKADNERLLMRVDNALAYLNQDSPYLGLILSARFELEEGRAGR